MSTFWISPDVNLSSIIKQNSLKYGFNEDELIETKIETRTIDSLINEYNIDWLRLDTEGMDYNLINSISINNLKKLYAFNNKLKSDHRYSITIFL